MKTKRPHRRYRSEAFAAIHETMAAMHRVGAVSKVTMREFDEACLETVRPLNRHRFAPCANASMFRSRFLPVT
jgi:DNA-binding transcriptional regulator YiaG